EPFDLEKDVIGRMKETQAQGKKNFIILVAEGVGKVFKIAEEIQAQTGIETRATVLGHVQRGGSPSLRDRVMASQMAVHAVNLLNSNKYNRVVGYKNDKIVDFDIEQALSMKKELDQDLVEVARVISI
ncbi:MAG: 6-phosphofructokinase, partial [Oscillospiraceae bacterium]